MPGADRDGTHHRRLLTADGGGATASPRCQEITDFERLPPSTDPLEATAPAVALANPLVEADPAPGRGSRARARDSKTLDELLFAASEAVVNAHLYGRRPITVRGWTGTDRIV